MRNNSRRRFCLGDQYCVWFWALTTLGRYPTHSPKLPLSASKKLKAAKLLNWAKVSQGQLQRQPGKYVAFSTTIETCECDPTWPYLHDPTDWQTFLSKKTAGTTAESVMCIWVYFAIGAIQGVGRHWRNCRWRSTCNFWCCRRGFYLGTQFGVRRKICWVFVQQEVRVEFQTRRPNCVPSLNASKLLKAAKLLNWAKVSQGQLQRQPGKYVAFSTTSETCECDPTWPYLHDPTDWQTFLSKKTAGTTAESVMCIWVYFAIGAI